MHRRLIAPTGVALACATVAGWLGMASGYLWTDYEYANAKPFAALVHGHLGAFFGSAPVEGPSLLLRAPFALLPSLWGGGPSAIYRTVAIPGLLAAAVLGVVLWDMRQRRLGPSRWHWAFLLLAAANPITLKAVETGHPEELMGAALCAGALLAALGDRRYLAGTLLGVAVANKLWALLAVGPVLLAVDRDHWRVAGLAALVALVPCVPFLLDPQARAAVASASSTDAVFQPPQIWWPLGQHGDVIRGFGGVLKPGFRAAPAWIAPVSHPLVAFLMVPATFAWRWVRRARSQDLLLLLATLFLARCVFDVADNAYYHLPFLLTLLTWEAVRSPNPPVLSMAASALVWLTCVRLVSVVSPDLQCLLYLAWSLPALVVLTGTVFRVRLPRRAVRSAPA